MDATRRSILFAAPMLAASGTAFAITDAQPLASFVKPYEQLAVRQNGQNAFRAILDGKAHSGGHIEVHETTLAAGASPHPPHRHEHEELFLMIKGELAVTIEGKTAVIGPGGAAFVHSGELHGAHNPGSEEAQYFVVATGV